MKGDSTMDELETETEQTSKCVLFCTKETALAAFGVMLGLVFIAMSLDMLRRSRKLSQEGTDDD